MRLHFQREIFDAFYPEALPLLQRHKDEIADYPDMQLEIDVDVYRAAEASGRLRIFTVRLDLGASEELKLLGYAVFFVGPHPHYKSSIQAVQDVLYLDPEQRKGRVGIDLIRFTGSALLAEGVDVVYQHGKVAHQALGTILQKEGYEAIEQVYAKRLRH